MNKVTKLCRDKVKKNVIKLRTCVSTSLAISIKIPGATAVSNLININFLELRNILKKISCHIVGHFYILLSSKGDKCNKQYCTLKFPGLYNIIIKSGDNLVYISVAT